MVNDKILASLKRLTKFTTRMDTRKESQKKCRNIARVVLGIFEWGADLFDRWAKIQFSEIFIPLQLAIILCQLLLPGSFLSISQ